MLKNLNGCICTILMCLLLTGCLPGKKQEEKVIQHAAEANQSVQSEKVAADMANAALTLMAGSIPATGNNDLQTFKCTDGKRVIAYIPKTSKYARNGAVAAPIANRMRDQLKIDFSAEAVQTAEALSGCTGNPSMMETVALNTPVLVLESFASQEQKPTNPDIVQVKIESCYEGNKKVPGIVVTKIMKDSTQPIVERHCGQAVTGEVDVGLSSTLMPNWRKRLGGDTGANEPFRCIVRDKESDVCRDVEDTEPGIVLKCEGTNQNQNYLANPVYDAASRSFISGPDRSCGRGWSGQLVGRVKSQSCQIIKDGKLTEPATVYEIGFVAAKCSRDNPTTIETSCPAGSDNPDGFFYSSRDSMHMKVPLALEPVETDGGTMKSYVALPGHEVSETDRAGIGRVTGAQGLFIPSMNLRQYTNPEQFTNALLKDMGDNIELGAMTGCNVLGNTCISGNVADHIVVILDRSASMGMSDELNLLSLPSQMTDGYQCRAGLKNLFRAEDSEKACNLVKTYTKTTQVGGTQNLKFGDFIREPWGGRANGNYAPSGDKATLYEQIETYLINTTRYKPHLQFALASGWDCKGIPVIGGTNQSGLTYEPFPADFFGTCSGPESCATCPGQCDRTPLANSNTNLRRIDAANVIMENLSRLQLRMGTKITVGSFVNDVPMIRTETYCPESRRKDGVCDVAREREAIRALFIRTPETKTFIKPIQQEIIIPSEKPMCEPEQHCETVTPPPVCTPAPGTTLENCTLSDPYVVRVVPDVRRETSPMNEANSTYTAPTNTVITGRWHSGAPTSGTTRYEYSTLKAILANGSAAPGRVTLDNISWGGWIDEFNMNASSYDEARVVVGRQVSGNNIRYMYATIRYEGQIVRAGAYQLGDGGTGTVVENAGQWARGGPTGVLYRRNYVSRKVSPSSNVGETIYVWRTPSITITPPVSAYCRSLWETPAQARASGSMSDNRPADYRTSTALRDCNNIYCEDDGYGGGGRDPWGNPQPGMGGDCASQCYAENSQLISENWQKPGENNVVYKERRIREIALGGNSGGGEEVCTQPDPVTTCTPVTGGGNNSGGGQNCTPGQWETVAQAKASGSIPNTEQAEYRAQSGSEYRDQIEFGCYTEMAQCDYYQGMQNPHQADVDHWCGAASSCQAEFDQYVKTHWLVEGCATCYGGTSGGVTTGSKFAKERRVACAAGGGSGGNSSGGGSGGTTTGWEVAPTNGSSNAGLQDDDYLYRKCIYMPVCEGTGTYYSACLNENERQLNSLPSGYSNASLPGMWSKLFFTGSYANYNAALTSLTGRYPGIIGASAVTPTPPAVNVHCLERISKTAASGGSGGNQTCEPDTTRTEPAGQWVRFQDAVASGTYDAPGEYEYTQCYKIANMFDRTTTNNGYNYNLQHAQRISAYFKNYWGVDLPTLPVPEYQGQPVTISWIHYVPLSGLAYFLPDQALSGIAAVPWDRSPPLPAMTSELRKDYFHEYCGMRRTKERTVTVPGVCTSTPPATGGQCDPNACDVSECAALAGGGGTGGGGGSGDWETFQQAGHTSTSPEASYMFGSTPARDYNDGHDGYEYGECHSLKREWDTAPLGGRNGACASEGANVDLGYPKINQQFIDTFGIEIVKGSVFASCAEYNHAKVFLSSHTNGKNGGPVPWLVTTNGVDEYTYCAKRRLLDTNTTPQTNGQWVNWTDDTWSREDYDKMNNFAHQVYALRNDTSKPVLKLDDPGVQYDDCRPIKAFYDPAIENKPCPDDYGDSGNTWDWPTYDFVRNFNATYGHYPNGMNSGRTNGGCNQKTLITPYTFIAHNYAYGAKMPWLVEARYTSNAQGSYTIREYVACTKRYKTSAGIVDNNALLACLDRKCAPASSAGSLAVESCYTARNLFTGATEQNCSTNNFATKLDYRPAGYKGEFVTATVTRYVVAKEGEAGAIEAPVGSMVAGADYGGNTPLLETIDQVLAAPTVQEDMNTQKKVNFVVITDGLSTDAPTTNVKSLCDSSKGSTLMSVVRANPKADAMFISLFDDGAENAACQVAANRNFVSDTMLVRVVSDLAKYGTGSGAAASVEEGRAFCRTYFGDALTLTEYQVPSGGSVIEGPNICRSYEVQ